MTKAESDAINRIFRANLEGRFSEYPIRPANNRNSAKVDRLRSTGAIGLEDGKGWFIPGVSMPLTGVKRLVGIDGRTYLY
jgi:hypothetical protein